MKIDWPFFPIQRGHWVVCFDRSQPDAPVPRSGRVDRVTKPWLSAVDQPRYKLLHHYGAAIHTRDVVAVYDTEAEAAELVTSLLLVRSNRLQALRELDLVHTASTSALLQGARLQDVLRLQVEAVPFFPRHPSGDTVRPVSEA